MDILNKIKQIQALSEIGMHYSYNDFDLQRYQEITKLCLSLLSQMTDISEEELRLKMVETDGYKTPKVDVRAVVFNENDEILMVKEKFDGCWSLPGGWADIGYSPSEIAVKESREEAGAEVQAVRLLGILDKSKQGHPVDLYYIYKVFIECTFIKWVGSDEMETTDYGFFPLSDLPPLSLPRITQEQIEKLFEYHTGKRSIPMFD